MQFRTPPLFATLVLLIGLVGTLPVQGNSSASSDVLSQEPPTQEPPKEVVIEPEGNQMTYATTELTVKPGQEVHLVFKNTASSPAMKHNVVVLETSEERIVKEVGAAGTKAGASNEYVPEHDAVLAHTPLADPGETVEVTFTAPDTLGDYTYLCTFPGHWMTMQGTLRVAN